MDNTPTDSIFTINFNAIVVHIDERGVGLELIGEHCHVATKLHAWVAEIVAVSKEFPVNG